MRTIEHAVLVTGPVEGPTVERSYVDMVSRSLKERRQALETALRGLNASAVVLAEAASLLVETVRGGHKILVAGNGGSAAEAQHFVAELVGRFKRERAPYAALSLATDTSILTAVANDYCFDDVFARQVRGLGQAGDALVVFSTSGESINLVRAAEAARERLMPVVAVVGSRPCTLERLADVVIRVLAADSAYVQEMHTVVTHILCDIVETELGG